MQLATNRHAFRCPVCERSVARRSRQQRYCGNRCRNRARYKPATRAYSARLGIDSGDRTDPPKTVIENNNLQGQKTGSSLSWTCVNDVTWKLTDGRPWRTPASFGQWGGYDTERALAWVMNTGWINKAARWWARCGDSSFGPTTLARAKAAAEAMLNDTPIELAEGAVEFRGLVPDVTLFAQTSSQAARERKP
jgi:hypothetical protein